jgi:hypothetical protein
MASIAEAQAAASAALTQLDPRLLESELEPGTEQRDPATTATVPPDEMRNQIEQLLYALIGRSDT